MGVVAAQRSRTRASRLVRRANRMPNRSFGRAAPQRTRGSARVRVPSIPPWAVEVRKTFWDRVRDDRELIGLKIVLLASLLLLTALLEWVA